MYKIRQSFWTIKSNDLKGIAKEFREVEKRRIHKKSNQITMTHSVVSFSTKDSKKVSDRVLKAVAKEFIRQRAATSLVIAASHHDRSHIHIHFAHSATRLDGYSSRISRQEFADLKKHMDLFQQKHFPDLIHSLPAHGKSATQSQETKSPFERFHTRKAELAASIADLLSTTPSYAAFLSSLPRNGIEPYYRGPENALAGFIGPDCHKYRLATLGVKEKVEELQNEAEKEDKDLRELQSLRERSENTQELDEDLSRSLEDDSDAPRDIYEDNSDQDRGNEEQAENENSDEPYSI